ncbi:helix-turn-helix domain-containing protein [Nucisporomicrobium flavum]|uniref:helix-turn-helix domain-containing protein n=1 Tax=Nucisporomicrobium flavum TaxID=2785915 RepID=UPI0027DD778B|nr:helix-turn-helix transcriptional regulator [Nucisporomicrobium flavum]
MRLIDEGGYRRNRQEICDQVGITAGALSQYLSGRTYPKFETLVKLAAFFDVSLDYMVYGDQKRGVAELDYGPLARYIDLSLSRIQSQTEQHSALVARVGRALAKQVDDAVESALQMTSEFTAAGMLHDDETLLLEGYSEETLLVSMNLQYDVIDLPDAKDTAGRFFPVVARNIAAGRSYQFLLPGLMEVDWKPLVSKFRTLLAEHTSGEKVTSYCQFRIADVPLFAGFGVYRLALDDLRKEQPSFFEQVQPYTNGDGWIGYSIPPSAQLLADALFDERHLNNALKQFTSIWKKAERV